jgi:hypothetical protein
MHVLAVVRGSKIRGADSSFEAVGSIRTGELAARKLDEHGRVLAVAAILLAELLHRIALFQLDADQNVAVITTAKVTRLNRVGCASIRVR